MVAHDRGHLFEHRRRDVREWERWVVTPAEFTASWRAGGSPADTVTGKSSGVDSVSNGFTPRRITGSTRR